MRQKKDAPRRLILYTLVFTLTITMMVGTARAQFHFGVKGGLTLERVTSVPESFLEGFPWKTKTGWSGGIFGSYEFIKGVHVQPEVLFIRKGARLLDPEYDFEARFNFDYLEIPVLFRIDLELEGAAAVPSIYFGPFFGFNRKANILMIDPYSRETEDLKDDIEKAEYGIALGLMFIQKWGPGYFSVDARYDIGLTNLLKPGVQWMDSIKTKTWMFMIGYSY